MHAYTNKYTHKHIHTQTHSHIHNKRGGVSIKPNYDC